MAESHLKRVMVCVRIVWFNATNQLGLPQIYLKTLLFGPYEGQRVRHMIVRKPRAVSIRSLTAVGMLTVIVLLSILASIPAAFSTNLAVAPNAYPDAVTPISKLSLTEWGIPTANASAYGITTDSDGKIWFTENATNKLARFDPANGNFTEWNITTPNSQPHNIFSTIVTVSSSQVTQLFFTEYASNRIARFDSSTNNLTEWVLPSGSNPAGIFVDDNKDVWFAESGRDTIGRLKTGTGNLTEWKLPGATSSPGSPSLKPWGVYVQTVTLPTYTNRFVWFTESLGNKIGRIEVNSNRMTLWDLGSLGVGQFQPNDIVAGTYQTLPVAIITDGNNKISVLGNDTGGGSLYQDANVPTLNSGAMGLVYDSKRNAAWFAENNVGIIGNLNTTNIFAGQLITPSYCTISPLAATPTCPTPAAMTSTLISATTTQPVSRSQLQTPSAPVTVTVKQGPLNGITEYALPTTTARPTYVAVDSGESLWFPEGNSTLNKIARLGVPYLFQISASPNTRTINPGQSTSFTISVTILSGATQSLTLSLLNAPSNVNSNFSTPTGNPPFTSNLTITTTNSTAKGTFPMIIHAVSGGQSVDSTITLIIQAPQPIPFDYSMSMAGPSTATVAQGGSASFGIVVSLVSGTPQAVNLTASGIPSGSSYSFSKSVGVPTYNTTLNIFTNANSPGGTYTITVTGTSAGGLIHTIAPILTVTELPRDFNLTAPVTDISLVQGSRTDITLTISSFGYFSGNVSLGGAFSPANSGMSVVFTPSVLSPQPNGGIAQTSMEVTAEKNTVGTYTLTITGTSSSPSRSHTVTLNVHVSECLIATATYGSELAPQVEFLKTFRDRQVLRTFAGSNFMIAFNSWYYSFSPAVAQYENSNPTARVVAKVVLYPLISVLQLSSSTFSAFGSEPEFAALIAGLLVGLVVGLLYLGLPIFTFLWTARCRIGSTARYRATRSLAILFILLLTGYVVSELLRLALAMILISSGLVLLALLMGGLLPGLAVLDRFQRKPQ